MNFHHPQLKVLGLLVLAAFSGCASTADKPKSGYERLSDAVGGHEQMGEPVGGLQSQEAKAQLHIMAGEMAAGRNQPELAAQEFLKALEFVADAELAERATALAVAARNELLAASAAQRWLALEPSAVDAREVIARVSLKKGALDEAQKQCEEMIRGHAAGPAEGFRHVSLLLSQAQDAEGAAALTVMQRLVAQWPELAAAHHSLGLVALRYNKLDIADQAVHKALALEPKEKEHSLLLVGILIRQNRIAEADAEVEKLVQGDERAADLRMGYAKLLLESNQRQHARAQLEKVLSMKGQFPDAHFALGVLALNDRDFATAEKHLVPLLEGERGKDAALQLGRLEEARRNYDRAMEYYGRVTTGTQALDAVVRRASVLARTGKLAEAQAVMRELRDQFPQLATRFYLAEGEILVNADALPEALKLYNEALAANPGDPDLQYGRSLVYERLRKIDLAEKDLRAVLKLQADDSRALNALGYMLAVHTKRLDEAQKLVARALELDPDDAAIIDSMGWIQFKRGNKQEAREWLTKAFDRFPDPEVAAHLGEVLWALGEKDQARAVWERALKDDPDHRVLKETVERLTR